MGFNGFQRWVRYADINYVNVFLKLAFTDYRRINNRCKICALIFSKQDPLARPHIDEASP
jgi:hypothetical protein